jgi:acyl carrier protein
MTKDPEDDSSVESIIIRYINREGSVKPNLLPIKNDTALIESGILDSLSILKLVLFIEDRFGVKVSPEDVVPENFETVEAICSYLRSKRGT